jgi:hypothetical protein
MCFQHCNFFFWISFAADSELYPLHLSARRLTPVRFHGTCDSSNGAVFGIVDRLVHSYLNPVANCTEMHSSDCRECISPAHSLLLFFTDCVPTAPSLRRGQLGRSLCWISWSRQHPNLQTSEMATDQPDMVSSGSDKCAQETNHLRPEPPEYPILCHVSFQNFVITT